MTLFKGKTLAITGGTGSFGNAVLNRFLKVDIGEIKIISRDEKKRTIYATNFRLKCLKLQSIKTAMHGVDYIFHAADLKQVPSCEFFPMEAVRTNVIGTDNVLNAAIKEGGEVRLSAFRWTKPHSPSTLWVSPRRLKKKSLWLNYATAANIKSAVPVTAM